MSTFSLLFVIGIVFLSIPTDSFAIFDGRKKPVARKLITNNKFKPKGEHSDHRSAQVGKPGERTRSSTPSATKATKPKTDEDDEDSVSSQTLAASMRLDDKERLQKIIARAGITSRRDAEKMIADGRVFVNGKLVQELGSKAHPYKDRITVDGKLLVLPDRKSIYWMILNKPKDCLTTMEDSKGRQTILDLIPKANDLRLVPVGRLERDATGILLLTNEVGWIHPLTHPSYSIPKQYELVVKGLPDDKKLLAISEGKVIPGTDIQFPKCNILVKDVDYTAGLTLLEVTVVEASPTVLGEMVEALDCELVGTKRIAFGPLRMRSLKKGEWRELMPAEITKLKQACKLSEKIPDIVFRRKPVSQKFYSQEEQSERSSTPVSYDSSRSKRVSSGNDNEVSPRGPESGRSSRPFSRFSRPSPESSGRTDGASSNRIPSFRSPKPFPPSSGRGRRERS